MGDDAVVGKNTTRPRKETAERPASRERPAPASRERPAPAARERPAPAERPASRERPAPASRERPAPAERPPAAERAPGRPRSARVDDAILAAALAELGERGYARMSVDAVAARAGVSKPTIYLRHPTKADMATAAIASMRAQPRPEPTGDVRADLVAHLKLLRVGLERPNGMAMFGTVLAEETETPELLALYRERLVAPRRRELKALLEAAGRRGELRPDANLEVAVTALVGAFFARYLAGDSLGGRFVTTLVDTVLDGLSASPRGRAR
jgi:AcrR family transcriptional regulator